MRENGKRRLLSLVMALSLLLGLLPATALASGPDLTLDAGSYTATELNELISRASTEDPSFQHGKQWLALDKDARDAGDWSFRYNDGTSVTAEKGVLALPAGSGKLTFSTTVSPTIGGNSSDDNSVVLVTGSGSDPLDDILAHANSSYYSSEPPVGGPTTISFTWSVTVKVSGWDEVMKEDLTLTYRDDQGNEITASPSEVPAGIDADALTSLTFRAFADSATIQQLGGISRTIRLFNMAKYYDLGLGQDDHVDLTVTLSLSQGDLTFQVGQAYLSKSGDDASLGIQLLSAQDLLDNMLAAWTALGQTQEEFPFAPGSELTQITLEARLSMERNQEEHTTQTDVIAVDGETIDVKWEDGSLTEGKISVTKTAGDYNWKDQTITWTIQAEPSGVSLSGATLTDTLNSPDAHFTGAFVINGQKLFDIAYDPATGYSVSPDPVDPNLGSLVLSDSTLSYTFPQDETAFPEDRPVEIQVTTKLEDSFFAGLEEGTTSWPISNSARMEKTTPEGEQIWGKDDASQTITTQGLIKKGSYNAAASGTIDWSITLEVPCATQNLVLYDLLPPDVTLRGIPGLDFDKNYYGIPYDTADIFFPQDSDTNYQEGFTAYAIEVTTGNCTNIVTAVRNILGDAFPQDKGTTYPEELITELEGVTGTRYLLVIVPNNGTALGIDDYNLLPSGNYVFKFSTPIVFGYDEDYKTENTAHVTWWNRNGPGPGHWEKPITGVSYIQAMVSKVGEKDESTRTTTWTIAANNSKEDLTNVTLEDKLSGVLKRQDPAETSELVRTPEGQLDLKYQVDGSDWQAVRPISEEGEEYLNNLSSPSQLSADFWADDFWQSGEPAYYFHEGSQTLYIFTPHMAQELYTFRFQTIGTGYNFRGFQELDGTGNPVVPAQVDDLKVKQQNTVTLYSGTQKVTTGYEVTYTNRLFAKEGVGQEPWTPDGIPSGYNPADNTFWWALYVNCYPNGKQITTVGRSITDAVVTDTLPSGFQYLDCALYRVDPGTSLTQETLPADFVDQSSGLAFRFGELMEQGAAYVLYVKTQVDPKTLDSATGTGTFTNRAVFTGTNEGLSLFTGDSADQKITAETVTKTGQQLSENGKYVYDLEWTIDVNRNGRANGYDTVRLTDTLPDGVTYTGAEVYRYESDYTTLGTQDLAKDPAFQAAYLAYDEATRLFTFTLPANPAEADDPITYPAYRVILRAEIDPGTAGTKLENKAQLLGDKDTIGSGESQTPVYFFGASIGAQWTPEPPEEVQTIQLKKLSAESQQPLKAAVFTAEYTTAADYTAQDTTWISVGTFTTDADGLTDPITLPEEATAVKLTEIHAPDGGYQMPEGNEAVTILNLQTGALDTDFGRADTAVSGTDPYLITIQNEPQPNTLTLVKVSSRNANTRLAGAEFRVEYTTDAGDLTADTVTWQAMPQTYVTDGNGTFSIPLEWTVTGVRVTELSAPDGYRLPADVVTILAIDTVQNQASLADENPDTTAVETTLDGSYILTVANAPRGGGGGYDPTPGPGTDPTPGTDLPDENVPLTDLPEEDLPEEEVPLTDLPEEEIPLADAPATGDNLMAWAAAAAVSGLGLVWLAILGKKRKGEPQD